MLKAKIFENPKSDTKHEGLVEQNKTYFVNDARKIIYTLE